jgi:hypothetical protein
MMVIMIVSDVFAGGQELITHLPGHGMALHRGQISISRFSSVGVGRIEDCGQGTQTFVSFDVWIVAYFHGFDLVLNWF